MHKLFPAALACGALHAALAAQDPKTEATLQDLRQRVEELEEQQLATAERVGGRALLQAYTAASVDLGGHLTSVFASLFGEQSTETGHVVSLIELYLKARIDDRWSVFATPGFYTFNGALSDDPVTVSITGDPVFLASETSLSSVFLSRGYGEYVFDDRLRLQGGIVGSPHGTVNREYFVPARTIVAGNLHTRYFLENQLYPQQLLGVRALGKLVVGGENWLDYDAYFGADDDSPSDAITGLRLAYTCDRLGLTVAGNYGRGTREGFPPAPLTDPAPLFTANVPFLEAPFPGRFNLTRDYQFGGVDVEWRTGSLLARTEAYYSAEADVADQRAFSQELNWFASDTWTLSYRFDWYDTGADLDPFGTTLLPRGHASEHVAGVCWSPREGVRLRLDAHHLLLPNTSDTLDYVNLSWSLSF